MPLIPPMPPIYRTQPKSVVESIQESKQVQRDKRQDIHRIFNSTSIVLMLIASFYAAYNVNTKIDTVNDKGIATAIELKQVVSKFDQLTTEQHRSSELAQLVVDEGYRRCIYDDSRGLKTIGFGHLMLPTDTYKCLTKGQAVALLIQDYSYAENSVDKYYPWAYGEVRLVLINMTYQLGSTGVSKFKKTLDALQSGAYTRAAVELLDSRWASQTPSRASRLTGRILAIPAQ